VRLEAAKNFDQIDMIFFEGDANMRPWSPNAEKATLFNFNLSKVSRPS
jgi:hypothetical protein